MIPPEIKYDGNATPPQFTDNGEQVIERKTQVRVKIKGMRAEVNQMFAVATIREDFLGYVSLYAMLFAMEANRDYQTSA